MPPRCWPEAGESADLRRSAGFEQLVDPLVRQAEKFGCVSAAEPEVGGRFDRLDGLLLSPCAGSFGGAAGSQRSPCSVPTLEARRGESRRRRRAGDVDLLYVLAPGAQLGFAIDDL